MQKVWAIGAPVLVIVNGLFAISSLAAGNYGGAIFSGAIAGILAWQMTW